MIAERAIAAARLPVPHGMPNPHFRGGVFRFEQRSDPAPWILIQDNRSTEQPGGALRASLRTLGFVASGRLCPERRHDGD